MASTAHKNPEDIKEFFEEPDIVDKKGAVIAQWIRESRHCIIFTGAGISTSAGIPDFRGPEGVWTMRAQGKTAVARGNTLSAIPTDSHMGILELQKQGLCKYLVSQNTDGLHRRSGIETLKLSELHGNSNLEKCESCKAEYLRDSRVRTAAQVHEHYTGKNCPKCGGKLHDTIINFGESLPHVPLQRAYDNAQKADLCLVLGSSLTVSPANDIPKTVAKRGGKLIICNLQRTPLDDAAKMRVFAKTDDLMRSIFKGLQLEIPKFVLRRRVAIEREGQNIRIQGVDFDGTPASIFKMVAVSNSATKENLRHEPFEYQNLANEKLLKIRFYFMEHYLEPPFDINVDTSEDTESKTFIRLDYDPYEKTWTATKE
eukprot:TRINITY_DN6888_c0_g1_i1.p1 TRINITY_DN6888_c0_g1~~TRINITY_DN6888_c0_g1_i1.p1  ORF type:complete len:371 (+),score=59.41 TRINITY_DN6888_c0_g1_i1:125-1237(+)